MARIARDRDEKEAADKAARERERLKNMTEEERAAWERANPKASLSALGARRGVRGGRPGGTHGAGGGRRGGGCPVVFWAAGFGGRGASRTFPLSHSPDTP